MVSLAAAGKVPDKTALYVVPLTFDVDPKLIPDGKEVKNAYEFLNGLKPKTTYGNKETPLPFTCLMLRHARLSRDSVVLLSSPSILNQLMVLDLTNAYLGAAYDVHREFVVKLFINQFSLHW